MTLNKNERSKLGAVKAAILLLLNGGLSGLNDWTIPHYNTYKSKTLDMRTFAVSSNDTEQLIKSIHNTFTEMQKQGHFCKCENLAHSANKQTIIFKIK